jgi:hypothetical protein
MSNPSDPFIRLAAEIVADAVIKPEDGGGIRFGRLVAILRRGFEDMRLADLATMYRPSGHPASDLIEELAAADAEPEPPAEPPSQCLGPEA